MTGAALVALVCAVAAVVLLVPPRRGTADLGRWAVPVEGPAGAAGGGSREAGGGAPADDWLRRHRGVLSLVTGAGAMAVVGGAVGGVLGVAVAVGLWRVVTRLEPAAARREREAAAAQLPVLVDLLAAALAAGSPPDRAVAAVCDAWPGAAADRLAGARARLALGVDPVTVWEDVSGDEALAPLGRTLARAASSGAPVGTAVAGLADDLAEEARAGVEDRARTVGVRAALPLGLCLLPAFVLLGIVPLAAGLLSGLTG